MVSVYRVLALLGVTVLLEQLHMYVQCCGGYTGCWGLLNGQAWTWSSWKEVPFELTLPLSYQLTSVLCLAG